MLRIGVAAGSLATLLAVSLQAGAQSSGPANPPTGDQTSAAAVDDQADALHEVVVVATRTPTPLDQVGNSVTVLDQQAIQSSQANEVSDLLATTPGITFNSDGGPGSVTSVNIRGADSDQTMVLIDGVALNDPSSTAGGLDFGNLLLGDISRIEILRGAQSTLYGSQAIGGVINIITAEPTPGLSANAQAEYGSLDTNLTKAGVGGKFDNWSFRLGGSYYTTDSVSAFDERYGGKETDPDHNAVFSGRANYDFAPAVQLDLRAYYTHSLVDYDGYPPPDYVLADQADFETVHQLVDYSGLNFDLADGQLQNRVDYQYTLTNRADYLNTEPVIVQNDAYSGANGRFEYQGTWAITDGYRLVFGAQQERSWMNSTPYAPPHADTADNSVYAQVQATVVKGLTLSAGERHDNYDTFGQHYTGQAAAAWSLPSSTILRASWAQGYKAPSLYQLYSPYGNPALDPEQSVGGDAGVEQHLWNNRLMLSATYFITHFRNLIEYESCPGSPLCSALGLNGGYYDNLGRARAQGVELQASATVTRDVVLAANYSHIETIDETPGSPTFGMQAFQRPENAANASVSYTWPYRIDTTVAARFSSYSLSENSNVYPAQIVHLGGYTLLNLRVSYPVLDDLELYGRVDNATNKWYETVYEYGTWGRTAFIGVRAKL